MKVLFVGGPSDGHRRQWPTPSQFCKVFNHSNVALDGPADLTAPFTISTATYALKRFVDENGKEHFIAFADGVKNTIEALIKGYRYHRNPRPRYRPNDRYRR